MIPNFCYPSPVLLLPVLLTELLPMLQSISKCREGIWSELFDCNADQNCAQTTVSRYWSGKRRIPRSIIMEFADLESPLAPRRLYKNLCKAIEMMHLRDADRRQLHAELVNYVNLYVDPVDRADLLPEAIHGTLANSEIALLLCHVLYYTICHDYAA